MRLDPSVRARGDLIEPFQPAQIAFQVTRNGSKALGSPFIREMSGKRFGCRGTIAVTAGLLEA